ncbi:hypothetical protein [Geoalkalibacter subterraneus]|uniref:Uncharacterized protein n=1 Tax=Geoalkalibacter subterraneus TaxID=483547 RepID=A0A0B5FU03_9BACT|nr:hypothetical protein [Geoalkalibacter subterraneus]AJF08154.1 hypothetical protein GSUB_16765 [Geoalkalibacter subterraneus]
MIAFGFFFNGSFSGNKDFEKAVDQTIANLEVLLADSEITSNINMDDNRDGTFSLVVEVPQHMVVHHLVMGVEEILAELGFMSEHGLAVESLYEGEESVDFYGFPSEVEDLQKNYQPIGAESVVGLSDWSERDCYEVMFG